MKFNLFLFFLFFFYSINTFATNIRVVEFNKIIESNKILISLYDEIKNDQLNHTTKFEEKEKELKKSLDNIDQLRLILDNDELESEINTYNDNLNKFNIKIKKFNDHYDAQINNLRNQIIDVILNLLKQYSEENAIDLILDNNSYIISSNSINITEIILSKSNQIKIEFSFEKY